jgi:lichenan operon transcriptional antiterminator
MSMTAERPTIAIAVNEEPSDWGEHKVSVVALIAFAASGREEFQSVFEQIVDVFADRTRMNEVVKNSSTFGNFIDTLVHVIET